MLVAFFPSSEGIFFPLTRCVAFDNNNFEMIESAVKHKSIEKVVEDAKRGIAFSVDRAVLNGDLAELSEAQQRIIVAMAHDIRAAYANDCVIPTTAENAQINSDFVRDHQSRAINFFFKADCKELKQQILDSRK